MFFRLIKIGASLTNVNTEKLKIYTYAKNVPVLIVAEIVYFQPTRIDRKHLYPSDIQKNGFPSILMNPKAGKFFASVFSGCAMGAEYSALLLTA